MRLRRDLTRGGERVVEGRLSPISSTDLALGRPFTSSQIPLEANSFAFAYPIKELQDAVEELDTTQLPVILCGADPTRDGSHP